MSQSRHPLQPIELQFSSVSVHIHVTDEASDGELGHMIHQHSPEAASDWVLGASNPDVATNELLTYLTRGADGRLPKRRFDVRFLVT